MPISLTQCDENPLCYGYSWTIVDEDLLAKMVAKLLLGQYRHVEKILYHEDTVDLPPISEQALEHLQNKLTSPPSSAHHYLRDGWVFQMIAWIAARISNPEALMAIPHSQEAQKGFDNLIVLINQNLSEIDAVIICEDKATQDSRSTVRDKVWPEIKDFESGRRDSELLNEVTPILERAPHGTNVDACLTSIFWEKHRFYRVSITADGEDESAYRRRLFRGYDNVAQGALNRRRAETVKIDDLRSWMDNFCAHISENLREENVR